MLSAIAELGPMNEAMLPTPFWVMVRNVPVVDVEFMASDRRNCSLERPSILSASKAAGTAPSFFLGVISLSNVGVPAEPPIWTPKYRV